LWAADTEVKDNQEWQLSSQQPRPAWMDASPVACQQKGIAKVAATARCLSQQNSMCPAEAVTAFPAQTVMTARQQQHCRKAKGGGMIQRSIQRSMQGKVQHSTRGNTTTCDSTFYTRDSQEDTAAAAA